MAKEYESPPQMGPSPEGQVNQGSGQGQVIMALVVSSPEGQGGQCKAGLLACL